MIGAALTLDGFLVSFNGEASIADRSVAGEVAVSELQVDRYLAYAGLSGQGLLTWNGTVDVRQGVETL